MLTADQIQFRRAAALQIYAGLVSDRARVFTLMSACRRKGKDCREQLRGTQRALAEMAVRHAHSLLVELDATAGGGGWRVRTAGRRCS